MSTIRRRSRQSQLPEVWPAARWLLALGEEPWGQTHVDLPGQFELLQESRPVFGATVDPVQARYGAAVIAECEAAGFQPAFVVPLEEQSEQAQAAARAWRTSMVATYPPGGASR